MRLAPFLLLLTATSASAAEPAADSAITVTGTLQQQKLRDRVAEFVHRLMPPPVSDQYARWNAPICPRVIGIGDRYQQIVIDRMVHVARDSGAPTGKPGCKANVVVTFSADAAGLLRKVMTRDAHALDETAAVERQALLSPGLPVRWWSHAVSEGVDGQPLGSASAAIAFQNNIPDSGRERFVDSTSQSFVATKVRASIVSVAIIVDVPRVTGVRLDVLAEYLAFVALARPPRVAGRGDIRSILGLFPVRDDGPAGLSDWDRAYLAALAAAPPDRLGNIQHGRIVATMAKALEGR